MGALDIFSKETAEWFLDNIGSPTQAQEQGWPVIAAGGHVLISSPTGTGKTLAAFLAFIDSLKNDLRRGCLGDELRLIYISPLKALGNDIRENLKRPLEGIAGPRPTAAVRTGDTTASERQRMIKRPPNILITTPESLFVLLSSHSGRKLLKSARAVIIDELHALIGGKRGAHLMLSLARLDRLCGRRLQRVGLSATISPLEEGGRFLAHPEPVTLIAPTAKKSIRLEICSPLPDMRSLPEGTIWPEIAKSVLHHCMGVRTVIAFVESRMQAERLTYNVNRIAEEGFALAHHGCVSREQRFDAEEKLRSGRLRLLVATSSMELGIDVGDVDLVIQVGCPRSVSGTLQRMGRAGHNPGRTSVMRIFPRTVAESLYCGLTAKAASDGGIENVSPPVGCLDVLAQHLVSMAAAEEFAVDELMDILSRAYNFRKVERRDVESVLRMLAGDFEHELDRPARPRLLYDRINGRVSGDAYSRMLALGAGGTIPDRGWFSVRLPDGTKLGELDEEFVFEARVGDKFLLGANSWKISEIRRDEVLVAPSSTEGAQSPFWKGDWGGRAFETGKRFGATLRDLSEALRRGDAARSLIKLGLDDAMAANAADFLERQVEAVGLLPDDRTIIVEYFIGETGFEHMMAHSVFGHRVNAPLSLLISESIKSRAGIETVCFSDDDGVLAVPYGSSGSMPSGILESIDPDNAVSSLDALLPGTALFNMAFRYNAARSLMMGIRQGRRQPLWVQRMRAAEELDRAARRQDHPLVAETKRECLEDYWDLGALCEVLAGIRSGKIRVVEHRGKQPSPMSLPIRRSAESTLMYDYVPMSSNTARSAEGGLGQLQLIKPSSEELERVGPGMRHARDAGELHSMLMAQGDMQAGEVNAPARWLEILAGSGRVAYIEPGLWIAAEQEELYHAAALGDRDAGVRIARRCLRYKGAQSSESLSERYFWPLEDCEKILSRLAGEGAAVMEGDLFHHAENYSRARKATISARRREIVTMPPERYAALLARRTLRPGEPRALLRRVMEPLCGVWLPLELWEGAIFPSRCGGYREEMLDELLAEGDYYWQIKNDGRMLLTFLRTGDIDWDSLDLAAGASLSGDEAAIAEALRSRGAGFIRSLTGVITGPSPVEPLLSLAARGLVRADSFGPVRQLQKKAASHTVKRTVRERVASMSSGRWELCRPQKELGVEEALEGAFTGTVLLCRETMDKIPWQRALETLRLWEYTGRARRGYFIKGLSGAQFIREEDYRRALDEMQNPGNEIFWLCAADPAQPWGGCLRHLEGREFNRAIGTVVALRGGLPVAALERHGSRLRVFDPCALEAAAVSFARDYEGGRIFPGKKHITIKNCPETAAEALEKAGFKRQMLDYVIWQKRLF